MTSVSATTLRGYRWLVSHWNIPFIALAAGLGWLFGGRRRSPAEIVANELESVKVARDVERFAEEKGPYLTNQIIDHQHRHTLQRLTEQQRARAEDLRRYPGLRYRYLCRLSDRIRDS